MQQTQSSLKDESLQEKLWKQDFHYDIEEISETDIAKQVEATEYQIQNQTKQRELSKKQIQALLEILLTVQHKQSKIRQVQYNTVVIL